MDAQRESEVVSKKSSGFAVAGFIPNKEKLRSDLDAMKKTQQKGLLWLFNKQGNQQNTIASDTIEPIVPAATNLTSPVEKASSDESLSATTSHLLLEPKPLYQFGTGEYSSHLLHSSSDLDFLELSINLNQDRLSPLYDASSSRLVFPFYYYNPSGVLDLDLSQQATPVSTSSESASSSSDVSSLTGRIFSDYDSTGRLNIYIYKPPSWVLPDTTSSNNASSIGDVSRYDAFIDHVDAFNRGFETARDGLVDAALHPIRTLIDTATLVGDGANAISNVTLGISTEGARQRNRQRVALYREMKDSFIAGDSVYRTEILTELGASLILGSVSGSAVGRACSGMSRQSMIAMNQCIVTSEGLAVQQLTIPALYHRVQLTYGNEKQIYRIGDSSKGSRGAEGQFWSVKKPDEYHAHNCGMPAENAQNLSNIDIRLAGEIKPNKRFITRPSPCVKRNPGGAIEVVVEPGSVKVTSTTVPVVEQQIPPLLFRKGKQVKNAIFSDKAIGALAVSNHTQENRNHLKLS